MTADVETTGELFGQIFGKLLQRPAEAIGTVVFLFYVNWQFSAVVFFGALARRVRPEHGAGARSVGAGARRRQAENFTALEQIASGIKVIKAMGSAAAEWARYERTNSALYAAKMKIEAGAGRERCAGRRHVVCADRRSGAG